MIQIIVVIASILLGLISYPLLLKTYTRIVTNLYRNLPEGNKYEKEDKSPQKENKKTSIIGKSKRVIGHSQTKTATASEAEVAEKKEHTFAPGIQKEEKESGEIDIYVPLEKIEKSKEEDIDLEEESQELETAESALLASGVCYDDLITIGQVITKDKPSDNEKDKAGRILYENWTTDMVEQAVSNDEKTLVKVNALISFHVKKHNPETENTSNSSNTEDFENFNFNSLFQ